MKHYSDFTKEYVQDICNALNSADFKTIDNKAFDPDNFKTLTELLHDYVVYRSSIYDFLNQKVLINRDKCPYTGQQISRNSPNYTYGVNSKLTIYLSPEGLKIMQREESENFEKLFGRPMPHRSRVANTGNNSGCLGTIIVLLGSISLLCVGYFMFNIKI